MINCYLVELLLVKLSQMCWCLKWSRGLIGCVWSKLHLLDFPPNSETLIFAFLGPCYGVWLVAALNDPTLTLDVGPLKAHWLLPAGLVVEGPCGVLGPRLVYRPLL